MTDQIKKSHRRRPVPISETDPVTRHKSKTQRLTVEELVAGMTPEHSEFTDDWPIGDELI